MRENSWIHIILLLFCELLCEVSSVPSLSDIPSAHAIRRAPINSDGVRRMPVMGSLLQGIGPIAFGKKDGDDVKFDVPNFGTLGVGDGKTQLMKFVPEGSEGQKANAGTFALGDRPELGYMEHDTTLGRSSGSSTRMSLGGLGSFITENNAEKGTGLLDFSKALFPFLELPPPKSQEKDPRTILSPEEQKLSDLYYPKPRSYVDNMDTVELGGSPPTPFENLKESRIQTLEDDNDNGNPFDKIKNRPYMKRFRVHAAKTATTEDNDLITKPDSPFDKEDGVVVTDKVVDKGQGTGHGMTPEQIAKSAGVPIPISNLGLNEKQVYELCVKFAPVAAKYCYGTKIDPRFIDRCRGYMSDCRQYQAQQKPLGAIANAFNSGVGLTLYDWGVNGIPYYPINEEGGIGNGHHGKIDFGSWGGGYSDEVGVRDFWSQTQEYGGNWYEGLYGFKRSWSVPVANGLGIEGGGGSQVHVPLKEGELGRPLQITNGYSVGPYMGVSDRTSIDWYNGGVSSQRGFAVPFVGVGVNTGVGVGFPSIGTLMNKMSLNGLNNLELARTHSGFDTSIGLGGSSDSSLSASTSQNGAAFYDKSSLKTRIN